MPDLPAVFGSSPLETVGVILFLVWLTKHTLNYLLPSVYTNWAMPILAAILGVAGSYLDNPAGPVSDIFRSGILAGASAVFLFSLYDNLMRGYKWYTNRRAQSSKAQLADANEKTQQVANFLKSVVSYWTPTKK